MAGKGSEIGRSFEEIERATDRDNYLRADEALVYGLIDIFFILHLAFRLKNG